MNAVFERILKRDRLVVAVALALIVWLGWIYLLSGAGMGMSAADMTRMVHGDHSVMRNGVMTPAVWTPGYALLMFFMWWIMMIAMMLPSAAPVVLLAAAVNRRAAPDIAPYGRTQAFMIGYLLAWALFSLLATAAQWGLQSHGLLSGMTLRLPGNLPGGTLLILAALWQLTPLKQACLRQCRSPVQLLVANRARPALLTGLRHGAYCVGCCWLLMALLFVGGVMNLFWIAGLTAVVLAEKLLPGGRALAPVVAGALALAGMVLIMR